jgi:hypothetical protein
VAIDYRGLLINQRSLMILRGPRRRISDGLLECVEVDKLSRKYSGRQRACVSTDSMV